MNESIKALYIYLENFVCTNASTETADQGRIQRGRSREYTFPVHAIWSILLRMVLEQRCNLQYVVGSDVTDGAKGVNCPLES